MAKQTHRKITLFIDGEEKTYHSKFASARNVFKAQEMFKRMEQEPDKEMEIIDEILDFIAKDIYHSEFTKDDILDGIDAADFMEELQTQLIMVMTRDVDSVKKQAFLSQK